MLGFGFFDLSGMQERYEQSCWRALQAQPWSPDIKWQEAMLIDVATWAPPRLFDCPEVKCVNVNTLPVNDVVISPDGRWLYANKVYPPTHSLKTYLGCKRGKLRFTGPALIPALHGRLHTERPWEKNPWMSFTPMEFFTLRGGTRFSRGHTIVAGLGLGHQLREVTHRKQVKRVTLIERSQSLVDFIMPALKPLLGPVPVEVLVGDAYKVLPTLTADVALVDIYQDYGDGAWDHEDMRLARKCPNIGRVWIWGGSAYKSSER